MCVREQEVRKDDERTELPHPWDVEVIEAAGLDPLDYVSWFPVPRTMRSSIAFSVAATRECSVSPVGWWMPDPFPDFSFRLLPRPLVLCLIGFYVE